MRTNLIFLNKEKLISIDGILPVMMELGATFSEFKLICIFPSLENLELVRKNRHLWEALQGINAKIIAPRRAGRISNAIWLVGLYCRLAFAKNIFIKAGDTLFRHGFFISCLRMVAEVVEIQYFILQPVYDFHEAMKMQWLLVFGDGHARDHRPAHKFDYYMTSLTEEIMADCYPGADGSKPVVQTGYVRGMNRWTVFLHDVANREKSYRLRPYCLFILSTFGKRLDELDEPPLIELFSESLPVLRDFSENMHVVFRPHPATNLDELERILEDAEFPNYSIDFGHPMILSVNALFVISNFFSATMLDASYLGVPTIEYCSYDKKLLDLLGNKSYGGDCCDFFIQRDPDELRSVVSGLLDGRLSAKKKPESFIKDNFPHTPDSFYSFFNDILVKQST